MRRGITKHRSMQDWLKSPAPGRVGGGGNYLKSDWKEQGFIDVWLHTKTLPMTVWRHGIPTRFAKEEDGKDATVRVWTRKYTCHETDDILNRQYWREVKGDPTSERSHPPRRCGICKLVEHVWQECWVWIETHEWVEERDEDGKKKGKWKETKKGAGKGIDPCSVLFRFEADDDEETTAVHAGGLCGMFGLKAEDMPEDLEKAMAARKIYAKDAWKENWGVKASSVMCIVDNDDPNGGVKISEQAKALGEKVKEEIVKVFEGEGHDIQRTPYCIRWKYDSKKTFSEMYSAVVMRKIKPSDRILKLIRGDAPDLSSLEEPFNQDTMRASLERHCLQKGVVPWDDLFPSKEQQKKWAAEDEAEAAEDEASAASEEESPSSDRSDDSEASATDDEDAGMVECDACGKAMPEDADTCPHCGEKYDVAPASAPKPEPKPLPKRSERKAAAKKPEPKPEREPGDDSDQEDADQDGDVPF